MKKQTQIIPLTKSFSHPKIGDLKLPEPVLVPGKSGLGQSGSHVQIAIT